MRSSWTVLAALSLVLVDHGQGQEKTGADLKKVYRDETHCLLAGEVRSAADNPNVRQRRPEEISCSCRDALADTRYVYQTYLITGKDDNLSSGYLSLAVQAERMCGRTSSDVHSATVEKEWRWDGPEVIRKYPPDGSIELIKPDSSGLRTVKYEVLLTYRDAQGRAANFETFSTTERLPKNFKASPCPPSSVCPK